LSGQVAPDGSYVPTITCCGEEAGQAAHKALTRYSGWSSRLRNGCKQRQEQHLQLGHGIMSGATWLAHTDLALPRFAPPSLGQGGEDGRSVGRGVSAYCDLCMHCAYLHGCAHPSRASHPSHASWQPKVSKQSAMSLHTKGPKH